jgi:RHS repeat-associated protein
MSDKSGTSSQIISSPKGGGALHGIGEKFSPDLFTGTGNFTVPIALPPGRNGFQPQLNLVYSTGNGNGAYGLGWGVSIPGISRQTSKGIPRYQDYHSDLKERDTFILSGAEDLVPIDDISISAQYRPRTEGLFARILHHHYNDQKDNYWEVRSKDGLVSFYGTVGMAGNDPAVITDPEKGIQDHIFAWKLVATEDPFHNRIEYEYQRDMGQEGPHTWDQLYLKEIRYVDYPDTSQKTQFLVRVNFEYQDYPNAIDLSQIDPRDIRPDPFSDYRAGFEIRTRLRCKRMHVCTYPDRKKTPVRTYEFVYLDERKDLADLDKRLPHNRVSLLSQIVVIGYDDDGKAYQFRDADLKIQQESLPPLEFGYTDFEPQSRKFQAITGSDLPVTSLMNQNLELVDLHGNGLPDILEMNGTVRYWRNLGNLKFDLPRPMHDAPPHSLSDPGVQMLDANGNGRMDLMVTSEPLTGYYPLTYNASWDRRSFQKYKRAPSFDLEDPEVKLIDLNGDGVTDAIRSGTSLECVYNDPHEGWSKIVQVHRKSSLDIFPNVNFSDPRVKLGDMTGDNLQNIVMVYDGNVEYYPYYGYGKWGRRIHMQNSPRFRDYGYTFGYDPRRILLGDVDGDGCADMVYVGEGKVTLWINQSGNSWSDPIEICGTPPVTDLDSVRLVDLFGTGISGVLWSADANINGRPHMYFLDFTGGIKPYVMNEMDNHMGAITKVQYVPSTKFYLEGSKKPATRWKTPLPFPVQVVERVEVIDAISRGKLTTRYRYRHGYWDGAEREFRGFGMVEQIDTETFDEYQQSGLHGDISFVPVADRHFSPPTLTKTWFHQGPVGDEFGEWEELNRTAEYWQGDPELLDHTAQVNAYVKLLQASYWQFTRRMRRDALRALRGSILRSELYALDRFKNQDAVTSEDRPYTVTEHAYSLREESPPTVGQESRLRIFFPHVIAQRTTQWERGEDPMTQFTLTSDYDSFGQPQRQTTIAMPRRSIKRHTVTGAVVGTLSPDETQVLVAHTRTTYATPQPQADVYIHDRVSQVKTFELSNPPKIIETKPSDVSAVLKDQWTKANEIHGEFVQGTGVHLIGHIVNHYDGPAFDGNAVEDAGQYGALTRSEALVFTEEILEAAYAGDPGKPSRRPDYLGGVLVLPNGAPAGFGGSIGYHLKIMDGTYEAGYYADTKRTKFDFQDLASPLKHGLVMATQDTLGNETMITPDSYWLLPVSVKDAAELETRAGYSYRTLQPSTATDPNNNKTYFRYTPIGLVHKTWLVSSDNQGGSEAKPELQYGYDFLHFERTRELDPQPIYVHTTARLYHTIVPDPAIPHSNETIQSREYSDGFGRLVQKRAQAEDLIFGTSGDDVGLLINGKPEAGKVNSSEAKAKMISDTVLVSGWQTYDNKGRMIEKYEPFFDHGWDFQPEADARRGERFIMFYDLRGQVIRTLNPEGSEQCVIFGVPGKIGALDVKKLDDYEPTPWEDYTYDANDLAEVTYHPNDGSSGTSLIPLTNVARDATHYYTPTSTLLDGMGRAVCQVQRIGDDPAQHWFVTRSAYDIRGNLLEVKDALGRAAFIQVYDLLNSPLRVDSIDAGLRTSVRDAQGNLIEHHNSKGSIALHQYDELNRPVGMWAINDATVIQIFTQREKIIYGDKAGLADAKSRNLLGKSYIHYDEAGKLTFERYDFKGNLIEKNRRPVSDSAIANGWTANWIGNPVNEGVLESQSYQTSTTFDALNRPIKIIYPREAQLRAGETTPHCAELTPIYNRAGALRTVRLDGEIYVDFIAYNAKGQRVLIAYGNKVMTRYAYHPQTFRLVRLRTERFTIPNQKIWQGTGVPLQDFTYQYDLAGNITTIQDRTPVSGIRNTTLGTDALDRIFTYDPIYRLLSATGREYAAGSPYIWDDRFENPGTNHQDPTLTSPYTQYFKYDAAGNMVEWRHHAANSYTKTFALANNHKGIGSNRLDTITVGQNPAVYHYKYDANGNMILENTERHFTWDHADRMIGYRNQATLASTPSVDARYLYDSSGMRIKKWVRTNGTGDAYSTTYIDGVFEYHLWKEAGQLVTKQNNYLQVIDNQSRIAIVRIGDKQKDDAGPNIQYHLGNHLGSSNVVMGGQSANSDTFINCEEYSPYGETSFGSFAKKRYRFTGQELDEKSGLYYHGARYFAPWLGRWISADPAGFSGGLNLYAYAADNPIRLRDRAGTQPEGALTAAPANLDAAKWKKAAETAGKATREQVAEHRAQVKQTGVGTHFGSESDFAKWPEAKKQRWVEKKGVSGPEQTNCVELVEDAANSALEAYLRLEYPGVENIGERISQQSTFHEVFSDSRGPGFRKGVGKVVSARGTGVGQHLHEQYGWKSLLVTTNPEEASINAIQRVGHVPSELRGKQQFVKGADTGIPVDVTLRIDAMMLPKGTKVSPRNISVSHLDMAKLRDIPFAIGIEFRPGNAGWGVHTFVLTEGRVLEAHWNSGPSDLGVFTNVSLSKFMQGTSTFVLVLPPGTLPGAP